MKKFLLPLIALAIGFSACATPAAAPSSTQRDTSLSGLLNGLKGGSKSGSGSGVADALGGLVSGLISNDKIAPENLVGTWNYVSPAVCFQSDNFLQKAGGAAMAGTIEGKLEPYYQRFGVDKLVLTVDKDLNFTMQSGKLKATGTITIDNTDVYFNFSALGKISLGKMKTYVTMTGSQMSVMFDVSKLMAVIKTVSSISGSSAISAVTKLLDSYEGICAGFKLQKQQ